MFARAAAGKVELIWNHAVDEVLGDETGVTGVRLRNLKSSATREIAAAAGADTFVAGSSVFRGEPADQIALLRAAANEHRHAH